jgi:hypothetical protein
MAEKEVEAIFGRPADYVFRPFEVSTFAVEKQWRGIKGKISVLFDWNGLVQHKEYYRLSKWKFLTFTWH